MKIPVAFHNLRGYVSHLIISAVAGLDYKRYSNVTCIPNNMEKYMSFTLGPLRFIDSYQFMAESLDVLSRDLADNEMPATKALVEEFLIWL